jgi:hypothetical protein
MPIPLLLRMGSKVVPWSQPGDNPNTAQTLEYTKDKYNAKIIK